MTLILKIGHSYKDRKGVIYKCTSRASHPMWMCCDGEGYSRGSYTETFMRNGGHYIANDYVSSSDLVEEVVEAVPVGATTVNDMFIESGRSYKDREGYVWDVYDDAPPEWVWVKKRDSDFFATFDKKTGLYGSLPMPYDLVEDVSLTHGYIHHNGLC